MADHEAATRSRLLAHSATTALVGTRVWYSTLPQEQDGVDYMPALVVQHIDGIAEYVMGGVAGQVAIREQVDCYATSRSGCQALEEEVRDALETYSGTQSGVTITFVGMEQGKPQWDADAKLWRCTHDFTGWGTE